MCLEATMIEKHNSLWLCSSFKEEKAVKLRGSVVGMSVLHHVLAFDTATFQRGLSKAFTGGRLLIGKLSFRLRIRKSVPRHWTAVIICRQRYSVRTANSACDPFIECLRFLSVQEPLGSPLITPPPPPRPPHLTTPRPLPAFRTLACMCCTILRL